MADAIRGWMSTGQLLDSARCSASLCRFSNAHVWGWRGEQHEQVTVPWACLTTPRHTHANILKAHGRVARRV